MNGEGIYPEKYDKLGRRGGAEEAEMGTGCYVERLKPIFDPRKTRTEAPHEAQQLLNHQCDGCLVCQPSGRSRNGHGKCSDVCASAHGQRQGAG